MSFRVAGASDCKTWVSSISKSVGRRGTFEKDLDLERCIFRGRRNARDMFIRDEVRALISWEGLHFGASDLQFWEDDFVTGAALCMTWHHLLVAGTILQRHGLEKSQNALVRGRQVRSAFNFPFLKEVSQDCFLFDVTKFKSWRSLAELLRFQACRLQIDTWIDRWMDGWMDGWIDR